MDTGVSKIDCVPKCDCHTGSTVAPIPRGYTNNGERGAIDPKDASNCGRISVEMGFPVAVANYDYGMSVLGIIALSGGKETANLGFNPKHVKEVA